MAGQFIQTPRGVVLHGSRSGGSHDVRQEFIGTVNFAHSPGVNGLGWNVTVGDDEIGFHIPAWGWGWHARAASMHYLSCEFAQATEAHDITDGQVRAFCWWLRSTVFLTFPNLPRHFPTHAEVERSGETGAIDGKTDVFSYGSARAVELRARIMAELNGG